MSHSCSVLVFHQIPTSLELRDPLHRPAMRIRVLRPTASLGQISPAPYPIIQHSDSRNIKRQVDEDAIEVTHPSHCLASRHTIWDKPLEGFIHFQMLHFLKALSIVPFGVLGKVYMIKSSVLLDCTDQVTMMSSSFQSSHAEPKIGIHTTPFWRKSGHLGSRFELV